MSAEPPVPSPGFWARALTALRGVGTNVVDLARVVLSGNATPGQIAFFAIGILSLACIGTFVLFAALDQPVYLFITFAVFAFVVLVLLCLMAWRMAAPGAGADSAGEVAKLTADLNQARAERDRATADLATRTSELSNATQIVTTRTEELAAAERRTGDLTKELQGVQEQARSLTVERDESQDWLRELYGRCEQIYRQIRSEPPRYPFVLEEVAVFTIEADGMMVAEQTFSLKLAGKLQMLLREFNCDVPARSVRDLQIAPRASRPSAADQRVVVLPAVDEEYAKKVVLVFLPEVPANAKLEYSFQWRWANFWRRFLESGRDTWETTFQSREPIPKIQIRFRLSPQLVPRFPHLRLSNAGNGGGQSEGPEFDAKGYAIYTWVAYDVPDGTTMKILVARADS